MRLALVEGKDSGPADQAGCDLEVEVNDQKTGAPVKGAHVQVVTASDQLFGEQDTASTGKTREPTHPLRRGGEGAPDRPRESHRPGL